MNELKRPSSTITTAALVGLGMTVGWELLAQFGWQIRPTLVAAVTTFASALAGYVKRENVLPITRSDEHEGGAP